MLFSLFLPLRPYPESKYRSNLPTLQKEMGGADVCLNGEILIQNLGEISWFIKSFCCLETRINYSSN